MQSSGCDVSNRKTSIDSRLAALKVAELNPLSDPGRVIVDRALKDNDWLMVAEAANLVTHHGLREFEPALREVWGRFCTNGIKRDPGCRARHAALTALDHVEVMDPEPFIAAIRYHQF